MTRLSSFPYYAAGIVLALGALTLSACSGGNSPDPDAKMVISPCLAFTEADANKMFGTQLTAFKLSGDGAVSKVCEFTDSKGTNYALIKLKRAGKIKDPVADLKADAAETQQIFKNNIRPIVIHPADGFGPGAYFVNNTTGPSSSSVQLNAIQEGYKLLVQVNNPTDFATGEKQATQIMNQILTNIKNGSAMQAL